MHVCDSARSSHAESHGGVLSYARPGTPNTTLNHHCVHDLFTVKWGGGGYFNCRVYLIFAL